MNQCTANSKRTGERCKRPPIIGKTVCYHHGGMSPRGIASATLTRDGRYSKHLPTRMLATYEAAKLDPNLLALQDEVALIDARLLELMQRVDTGESGATWKQLRSEFQKFQKLMSAGKTADAKGVLFTITGLITKGVNDEAAWSEIRSLVNQRVRLVESERKRLVEMQQMVNSDQAMLMVRSLVAAVREHVRDPAILRAIADDLGRLALARTD